MSDAEKKLVHEATMAERRQCVAGINFYRERAVKTNDRAAIALLDTLLDWVRGVECVGDELRPASLE